MEMLQLNDLHKTFNPGTVNEKVALNGVSLHMEAGDFATIVGSNGAGKSTLFNAITGGPLRKTLRWPICVPALRPMPSSPASPARTRKCSAKSWRCWIWALRTE